MVIIFIRHGEKAYRNGRSAIYAHDPPLTKRGEDKCADVSTDILKYGTPNIVYSSPYLRCRQTMECLLKRAQSKPEIIIDNRIAECLVRQSYMQVHDETAKYNPPHEKDYRDVEKRIDDFYQDVSKGHKDKVIWVVTHGIVVNHVHKAYNDEPIQVNFLDYFVIS